MEHDLPATSKRGRLMGKLFGKDRRNTVEEETGSSLDDFFRPTSDTLSVSHAAPSTALPVLAKLDTSAATRYPQAHTVGFPAQQGMPARKPVRSRKKNLVVRFADTWPEIIGEGGDECELPVIEISTRRMAKPALLPPQQQRPPPLPDPSPAAPSEMANLGDPFAPGPLKRTQTGLSPAPVEPQPREPKTILPGRAASTRYLESSRIKDENRRSFIEIHQAEMREAEGKAFAEAARSAGTSPPPQDWEDRHHSPSAQIHDSPTSVKQRPRSPPTNNHQWPKVDQSPSSIHSTSSFGQQSTTSFSRQASLSSQKDVMTTHVAPTREASYSLHDVVAAAGDDALAAFVARTRHLFELFRLHTETLRPISQCALTDVARAMLWWFLKGRMALELAVRERPSTPQGQAQNQLDREQAYADLAKGYWLSEEAIPEIQQVHQQPPDQEVEDARHSLVSNLKKLAISMKRNGFLPPEDAFLPQQTDKSIWVEYPRLSDDMIALLTAGGSAINPTQRQVPAMSLLESLPLGDTPDNFSYGRVLVDAFLMEQGLERQQLHFPCVLSMVRPQRQPNLVFILSSQNGQLQLRIQGNRNVGPTWEDLKWRAETCTLDIRLPRGFILVAQCSQADFRTLWNMHDFGTKVQATLYPRKDEIVAFRSTVKSFQYFDSDPQARTFPREPVAFCEVAMFERILREGAANGPRSYHRGFRIAVVTGPRTRSLSGVNHVYSTQQPIQSGFLRGDKGDPALLLKFDSGRQKGSMVLSFNDEKERFRFHSILVGTALRNDEGVFADAPLVEYSITQSLGNLDGIPCVRKQPWSTTRVVNDESGGDERMTTLYSDKLRVLVECKTGTITDRVNIGQGELRIRLEVTDARRFLVYRLPQQDMTISVAEAQVTKELPAELSDVLLTVAAVPTIRVFKFETLGHLHAFQEALTGCKIVFDGIAATFAISRRRMVVPIHKKWEAGWTRIQVVRQDKVLQILAFFVDFHHGRAMSFALKGTDVYETFGRGGRAGLKIVDAKFPLPRTPQEGDSESDDMAFVCLDLPDLPGEHDDISILFEKESERDQLCKCLPAPTRAAKPLRMM